jgi:hypothetical protein
VAINHFSSDTDAEVKLIKDKMIRLEVPVAVSRHWADGGAGAEELARTVVEGFFDGLHRSPFLGYSTEFSAYRAYTQGDNLRHIDWKVWGRTDEFRVKQFEDDTNELPDISGYERVDGLRRRENNVHSRSRVGGGPGGTDGAAA